MVPFAPIVAILISLGTALAPPTSSPFLGDSRRQAEAAIDALGREVMGSRDFPAHAARVREGIGVALIQPLPAAGAAPRPGPEGSRDRWSGG